MHATINTKEFLAIDTDSSIQNLSDENIFYTESVLEPALVDNYLTDGYLLKPLDIFKFEILVSDDPALKCWLYNPTNDSVQVQI